MDFTKTYVPYCAYVFSPLINLVVINTNLVMMKKWILPVLMCYSVTLFSQIPYFNLQIDFPVNLPQGGSAGTSGLVETDSFYYFAGGYNFGCDTGLIVQLNKFDLSLNILKIIVGSGTRVHSVLKKEGENTLIITGTTYACTQVPESVDFYLSNFSVDSFSNTNTQISGVFGRGEYPVNAITDDKNNIILAGWSFPADNSTRQSILVFKADSNFNEVFNRRYPSASPQDNHFGNDIVATPDGGYIIVGNHRLDIYEDAALIFKIDSLGNTEWWQEFNPDYELDEENLYFSSIVPKNNGEYIVMGYKIIDPELSLEYQRYWVVGFDGEGNVLWEREIYENHKAGIAKIASSNDGDFYICGADRDYIDSDNYWKQYATVGKISPQGDLLWLRKYHEEQIYAYSDVFWNVIPTQDGGILCVGNTYPNDEERQNIWVMKLDSLGCAEPGCELIDGVIELPVGLNSPIKIYPNPTDGHLKIVAKDGLTPIDHVIINDAQGRLVYQQKEGYTTEVMVDLTNAAAGIYFCRIELGGVWYVRQVVRQD